MQMSPTAANRGAGRIRRAVYTLVRLLKHSSIAYDMKITKVAPNKPWYHGSPYQVEYLLTGSTITQNQRLAQVFSHKPTIVSAEDDGSIRHNGTQPGFLYQIAESLRPEDITPHPQSSMAAGHEWLTTRELRLQLVRSTQVDPEDFLSADEIQRLLQKHNSSQND